MYTDMEVVVWDADVVVMEHNPFILIGNIFSKWKFLAKC